MKTQSVNNAQGNSYNPSFQATRVKLKGLFRKKDHNTRLYTEQILDTVYNLPEYAKVNQTVGNRKAKLILGTRKDSYSKPEDIGLEDHTRLNIYVKLVYDNLQQKGKKMVPMFLKRLWYGDERVVAKHEIKFDDTAFLSRDIVNTYVDSLKAGKNASKSERHPKNNPYGSFREALDMAYLKILKYTNPEKYERLNAEKI